MCPGDASVARGRKMASDGPQGLAESVMWHVTARDKSGMAAAVVTLLAD